MREDEAEWARRIGHDSVACRHRSRRAMRTATTTSFVAAACGLAGLALAAATGDQPAPPLIVLAVAVLFVVALVSLILGATLIGTVVVPERLRAQGYALRALLPTNPHLRIESLAPHLHRVDDFDRWMHSEGLVPHDPDAAPLMRWLWDPRRRRTMLPGRAASWWMAAATILLVAALFAAAASGLVAVVSPKAVPAAPIGLALGGVLLAASGIVRIAAAIRTRREGGAGYTTTVVRVRQVVIDARTAVDLVDARTGGVVRAAGALPLSTALYRARVRALRAGSQGTG